MGCFESMRRHFIRCLILCSAFVVLSIHFLAWPPSQLDNIPQPSCIELKDSGRFRRSKETGSAGIMIGVHLKRGTGYTNFTASIIKKYHGITNDLYLYREPGAFYQESTLRKWYGEQVTMDGRLSTTKTTGLLKILEYFTQSKYKILFIIDSETVFARQWSDFITQHMSNEKAKLLSLYHSATMHSYTTDCDKTIGDLCVGNLSDKYGIAMTKDFARIILSGHRDLVQKYDWNGILLSENLPGLYPKRSIVMKIGQKNQDDNFCGINDVPYGFPLCEMPCWIRKGVEFYFDLCTDPEEAYCPATSLIKANAEKRTWVSPAIAYSFYGNKPRYVKGVYENAKRVFRIYPGWKIWLYVDDTVSDEVVRDLCSYNVKFVNMTGTHIKNKMSWRFLIAAEPVKYFTILDIDYRMLPRGKEATDEWLESGRRFHVMRDHPEHSVHAINGQMWGGYGNSIPNMKQLIVEYHGGNWFMMDIHFLTAKIWPIVKKSVWVHDSYSLHKFGEDHPFPSGRKGNEFVGGVDTIKL